MCTLFNIYYRLPIVIIPKTHSATSCFLLRESMIIQVWFYCRGDKFPLKWLLFWKTKMYVAKTAGIFSLNSPLCLEIRKLQYFINTKTKSYINLIYLFNRTSPVHRWIYPPPQKRYKLNEKRAKFQR